MFHTLFQTLWRKLRIIKQISKEKEKTLYTGLKYENLLTKG